MNIKSKRIFAVSTIIAFAGMLSAPAFAEDLVEVVATTSVQATGIIHVENNVVNDNLGTKTAADFEFTVKHFGTNVEGSPFNITDETGMTFVLAPGTYVVAATSVDGYLGSWSGEGIENGFIDLQAGEEVTIVRYSNDIGIATPTIPVVVPVNPVLPCGQMGNDGSIGVCNQVTDDGGLLPATSTNWFNLLALGFLLSAAGAYSFRKNSVKI
jgi:LPXTG-motif cell wall-anchored protein